MKIAVIGAGAIGGLVAGYLKLKGADVSLVGRAETVKEIRKSGLRITGARGDLNIKIESAEKLAFEPGLAILAVKSQDLAPALNDNQGFLKSSTIITTQNGVQADEITGGFFDKNNIISSIVMFGSTCLAPAKIVHNFEGSWIIGKAFGRNDNKVIEVSKELNEIFPTIVAEDIKGMKYLKVFVNANNCIAAVLGKSMQEAFSDVEVAKISIAIWKEGLEIVSKAGINLVSLPDFPLERLIKLTSLPINEGGKIYSGVMVSLSKEPLYGSILQSIKRGKPSEIDFINGEFVRLAKESNLSAPLNEKLIEMVHQVERMGRFFSNEELILAAKELFN